jgi:hypothetical protein
MPHSNPYTRYTEQIQAISTQVLDDPSVLSSAIYDNAPGGMDAFVAASDSINGRAVTAMADSLPWKLKSSGVQHGMRVISLFAFRSAQRAQALGYDSSQLSDALLHPDTFQGALVPLASSPNEIAVILEWEYGISVTNQDPRPREHYQFTSEGAISLWGLQARISQYENTPRKIWAATTPDINISRGICAAHRAAALEPIYQSVVPVYAAHPLLGAAILGQPNRPSTSSPPG